MKKDILGIVLAHGKAREAVARHETLWKPMCRSLVYFTPVDDRLLLPGRVEYSVGKSQAYSADTNLRCREALRFAAMTAAEYVLLFEYDSFILPTPGVDARPPAPGEVLATRCSDPYNTRFQGKSFLTFPQLWHRESLELLVDAMDNIALDAEGGFTDRYIGYATEKAGLTVVPVPPALEYSKNHITAEDLPVAEKRIREGARWIHGVKDENVFAALLKATT